MAFKNKYFLSSSSPECRYDGTPGRHVQLPLGLHLLPGAGHRSVQVPSSLSPPNSHHPGIVLGELEGVNVYIFAVAGGMFLYISLVDMVPELNHEVEKHSRVSAKKALFTFFLQNVGIIIGVFSLYILAIYQSEIQL